MIEKKNDKKQDMKPRDDGVELENQFIIRLPEEPANVLREAIQTGNLKDRITIKLDNDLRYGEVRFDHWLFYAKVVDLPTIIECLKTIDNKSFYKSADICQLMICKEEMDEESEKESPNKGKKKDPNKVDKKYLWPHGITPPCKNVRKRRFRKTLKKKNVEAPEIEKEVKHLLRIDNEAIKVEYEIINEDLEKPGSQDHSDLKEFNDVDDDFNNDTLHDKSMNESSARRDANIESDDDDGTSFANKTAQLSTVAEHDIFGEELSSSDDEEDIGRRTSQPMHDLEESSRLSGDDSHLDFFGNSSGKIHTKTEANEFTKSMFREDSSPKSNIDKFGGSSSNLAAPSGFYDNQQTLLSKREDLEDEYTNDAASQPQLPIAQINEKISQLQRQIMELKTQQAQKSQEIATIQNATLKQRMQEALDNILSQIVEKELELKEYEIML